MVSCHTDDALDCNFYECRTLVELAAEHIGLNEAKKQTVSGAFDAVGIFNLTDIESIYNLSQVDYALNQNGSICVLGQNEKPYDNYHVEVYQYQAYINGTPVSDMSELAQNNPFPNLSDIRKSLIDSYDQTTTDPITLNYAPSINGIGIYEIRLADLLDNSKTYAFYVLTSSGCETMERFIYCGFGEPQTPEKLEYEMRTELIEFPLSDGRIYYRNEIEYPYFFGNTPAEQAINQYYAEMIAKYKANDLDPDARYADEIEWGEPSIPFYDDVRAEVTYNANGAISIKEISLMWSGGMHPYHSISGHIYDVASGKLLQVNDILIGTDEEIDQHLLEVAEAQGVPLYTSIATLKENTGFALCESGLCFYVWVGDAVGRIEMIVPFTDEDSYLIRVGDATSQDTVQEQASDLKAYISVINAIDSNAGYGALYDVDGNGIKELIVVFSYNMEVSEGYTFPYKVCSVYTLKNGEAIALVDKEILFSEAGGPSGYAGVIQKDGKKYIVITAESGETGGENIRRGGQWKLYSVDGASAWISTTVEYDYYTGSSGAVNYAQSSALIDGKTCSFEEYESWQNSLEDILTVNGYYWDETPEGIMTLDELVEYFQ